MTQKNRNQLINFIFLSDGCSLLRAEGFSCRFDVLFEGLGICKLQLLTKEDIKKNFCFIFFPFLVIKRLIRIWNGSVSGPES
jgi:hypothetical protein